MALRNCGLSWLGKASRKATSAVVLTSAIAVVNVAMPFLRKRLALPHSSATCLASGLALRLPLPPDSFPLEASLLLALLLALASEDLCVLLAPLLATLASEAPASSSLWSSSIDSAPLASLRRPARGCCGGLCP